MANFFVFQLYIIKIVYFQTPGWLRILTGKRDWCGSRHTHKYYTYHKRFPAAPESHEFITGALTLLAQYSRDVNLLRDVVGENFQLSAMRSAAPPPSLDEWVVWEKVKSEESAAGVVVFSGVTQVSVSARNWTADCEAKAGMKSALLTADWQFDRAR